MKYIFTTFVAAVFLTIVHPARGQDITVTLIMRQMTSLEDQEDWPSGDAEYRCQYSFAGQQNCAFANNANPDTWVWATFAANRIDQSISPSNPDGVLSLQCWEDDDDPLDNCVLDGNDNGGDAISFSQSLTSLAPRTNHDLQRKVNNDQNVNRGYEVRYRLYWKSSTLLKPWRDLGDDMCYNESTVVTTNSHNFNSAYAATYVWTVKDLTNGGGQNFSTTTNQFDLKSWVTSDPTTSQSLEISVAAFVQGVRASEFDSPSTIFTVQPGKPFVVMERPTPITCYNGKGAINVDFAGGGTPSHDYTLETTINGQLVTYERVDVLAGVPVSFTDLASGSYTLYVRNRNGSGCTEIIYPWNNTNLVIPAGPTELQWTGVKYDQVCASTNSGRIILSASGGAGGYRYYYNGIQRTGEISNLAPGNHTFLIYDNNGCSRSFTQTISPVNAISYASLNITNTKCKGGSDGAIRVDGVTGGKPFTTGSPYRYQFRNSGVWVETSEFTNLNAATYRIVIKDANDCQLIVNAVVDGPAEYVSGDVSQVNVQCNGLATGSFTVTGKGGNGAPYQFSLNNGEFSALMPSITHSNLPAGNYYVRIKDRFDCNSGAITVTISQPAAPFNVLVSPLPVSCDDRGDGAMTFTMTGGTGPYYYFDEQTGLPKEVTPDGSFHRVTFSNLDLGTYTIQARDARGCTNIDQDEWRVASGTVINAPVLEAFVTTEDVVLPNCYGNEDAKVTIRAQGGTATYWFSSDGENYDQFVDEEWGYVHNEYTFEDLSGGVSQTFYVKDSRNCESELQLIIPQTPLLTLTVLSKTDVDCKGNINGMVQLLAEGGTSPYTYSKTENGPFQNSASFESLTAQVHTFFVKDSKNCLAQVEQEITQPMEPLTLANSVSNITCYGLTDGEITLAATGGNGSYEYAINSGAYNTSSVFEGLAVGTYRVSVKDLKGCTLSFNNIAIAEPQQLTAQATNLTPVTCYEGDNGSFEIQATGGSEPYQFQVEDEWQTNAVISGLKADHYTVIVADKNNCTYALNVDLSQQPPDMEIETSIIASICGQATGEATILSVTHAQAPHHIEWFDETQNLLASGTTLSQVVAGAYLAAITDARNCTSEKMLFIPDENTDLVVAFSDVVPVSCHEGTDGSAAVQLSNSTAPFEITWPNGETLFTNNTVESWTKFTKGENIIQIRDSKQCLSFATVSIPGPDPLTVNILRTESPKCFDSATGSVLLSAIGGTPNYQYVLYKNNSVLNESSSPVFTNLKSGTYQVVLRDANACNTTTNFQIVEALSRLSLQTTSIKSSSCAEATDGNIEVSGTGGKAPYEYKLLDAAKQEIESLFTPIFSNVGTGEYFIDVRDANGCLLKDLVSVRVDFAPRPQVAYSTQGEICPGACAGSIAFDLSVPDNYTFFLDGVTSETGVLTNLCAGEHVVRIEYANSCSYEEIVRIDASTLALELGEPKVICTGQKVTLSPDLEGEYTWHSQNGFNSKERTVILSEAGVYDLAIKTPEGCELSDSYTITTSTDLLRADLIMADSAIVNEQVIGIDLTSPEPEVREWDFDVQQIDHTQKDDFYHEFRFKQAGVYTLELTVRLSQCEDSFVHTITAYEKQNGTNEPNSSDDALIIKKVHAFPNPTNGRFVLSVELLEILDIKVSMYHSSSSKLVWYHEAGGLSEYAIEVDLTSTDSGLYFVELKLSNGQSKIIRIVTM